MPETQKLVSCYNRGCGKDFDPNNNSRDDCCHHPGAPVFHDAYKGWSCCNKKSVDFTEFLNIKGCTMSKHSNVKPPEPEKKALDKDLEKKVVIEVRAPIVGPQLTRPPFDTLLTKVDAHIAEALKEIDKTYAQKSVADDKGSDQPGISRGTLSGRGVVQDRVGCVRSRDDGSGVSRSPEINDFLIGYTSAHGGEMVGLTVGEPLETPLQPKRRRVHVPEVHSEVIAVGTACKNGGCSVSYEGAHTNETLCTHHPGVPIFHEGLKFWSCCQKRTTDFNVFLNQPGCTTGSHKWTKEGSPAGTVKCRWDWHQTPENVIVSVYAKKYDPTLSFVKLNPIRLNTKLVFREQGDAAFELDLELRGVINVESSTASMLPSKVEIKLKKAEPGAWAKLDFPRTVAAPVITKPLEECVEEDDSVDLSTVEAIESIGKVNMNVA